MQNELACSALSLCYDLSDISVLPTSSGTCSLSLRVYTTISNLDNRWLNYRLVQKSLCRQERKALKEILAIARECRKRVKLLCICSGAEASFCSSVSDPTFWID